MKTYLDPKFTVKWILNITCWHCWMWSLNAVGCFSGKAFYLQQMLEGPQGSSLIIINLLLEVWDKLAKMQVSFPPLKFCLIPLILTHTISQSSCLHTGPGITIHSNCICYSIQCTHPIYIFSAGNQSWLTGHLGDCSSEYLHDLSSTKQRGKKKWRRKKGGKHIRITLSKCNTYQYICIYIHSWESRDDMKVYIENLERNQGRITFMWNKIYSALFQGRIFQTLK